MTDRVKSVLPMLLGGILLILSPSLGSAVGKDDQGRLILEGVVIAANPAESLALVRLEGAARARTLKVGDVLSGYVLLSVSDEGVCLRGSTGELRVRLGERQGLDGRSSSVDAPGSQTTSESGDSGDSLDSGAAVEPAERESPLVGGSEGWIRRAFARDATQLRLVKEMPVILSETGFSPRVEDGEVNGLRLTRLPDGTVLSESGLLTGDVLVSINEEPVQSLDALMSLLPRFRTEGQIRLVVDRRGETVKFAYDIH